ncbi:hypothetical protein ABW19_dt0204724 [Dactylella cylindrospora]|nr:hypothetical protein ABW19_dt0204724 [Dactylella cylindrospora]
MNEFLREAMGGSDRQLRETFSKFDDALDHKDPDKYNPYKDVDEEVDPFAEDPDEPPPYKTIYLPNEQLDEMMKTGFLKSIHEFDPLADEPIPDEVLALPLQEKLLLKKFFMKLQLARAHPSISTNKGAWRLFPVIYSKPHLAKLLNDTAWNWIWALDSEVIPTPKKVFIGDLMIYVGTEMTEKQWTSYIEALFWNNQRDRAFQYWSLGAQNNPSQLWYAVGARLHATENQPDAAKKIIQQALNSPGDVPAKLFIPTIVCYHTLAETSKMRNLKQKDQRYNQQALALYRQMLQHCPRIQQKEYLRVALSFLDAGFFKDALTVYQQMLSVYPGLIDDSATSAYWDWKFKQAAINAQNSAVDEDELQDLTVAAIKNLPEIEKSVILLGNWMRNLIRKNRIEAALRVAREMQIIGVRMDTTTYNLLLMLFDEHGKIGRLEYLSTRMIRRLVEPMLVHNATYEQVLHDPEFQPQKPVSVASRHDTLARPTISMPEDIEAILARFEQNPDVELPLVNEVRPKPLTARSDELFEELVKRDDLIPPADPATFGILLNRCTKSKNVLKATSVLQLLHKTKIQPNAHVIYPLLQMLAEKRSYSKLFRAYSLLKAPDGFNITADSRLYEILFQALFQALKDPKRSDTPSPRQLFADMVQRNDTVKPTRHLYHMVLRSFWRAGDPVGAYTAMHGMSLVWDMGIHKIGTDLTIVGIARVIGMNSSQLERRHILWYIKKLASEKFGHLVHWSRKRRSNRQVWRLGQYLRQRKRLKDAINSGVGDVGLKLEELRILNSRIKTQLACIRQMDKESDAYWAQSPRRLGRPKTKSAKTTVAGIRSINLDKGGPEKQLPDDQLEAVSDFIRECLFEGQWPQKWLEDVVLAKREMGLDDEDAIAARRMSLFDAL